MKRYEITLNSTGIEFLKIEDVTFLSIEIIVMLRLRDILFIHYSLHLTHKDSKCINEVELF
jgi:hypothetical protein